MIKVENLTKRYAGQPAIKDLSFEVSQGEIMGFLGPNGAGKSTTLEIIETLRLKTSGKVTVDGIDLDRSPNEIKKRIGVQLQTSGYYPNLNLTELLVLFGGLYNRDIRPVDFLGKVNLLDKARSKYKELSGGQKQRFSIATTLINQPKIIFLDEPTTGLDPQVRLEIHTLIEEFRSAKRTILLTTHYIEEAERLCDRVAIIDQGKIIAMGSPREIQQQTLGQSCIEVLTTQPMPVEVPRFQDSEKHARRDDGKLLTVYSTRPARTLTDLVRWIDQSGLELEDIHLKRPTLEDVFIELTGKKLRD